MMVMQVSPGGYRGCILHSSDIQYMNTISSLVVRIDLPLSMVGIWDITLVVMLKGYWGIQYWMCGLFIEGGTYRKASYGIKLTIIILNRILL